MDLKTEQPVGLWNAAEKKREAGVVGYHPHTGQVQLTDSTGQVWNASAWSVFHSLQEIRAQLELTERLVLCNASRLNFTVSGMALDMSSGLVGYLIQEDGVDPERAGLFDPIDETLVATIAQQQAFREARFPRAKPWGVDESE